MSQHNIRCMVAECPGQQWLFASLTSDSRPMSKQVWKVRTGQCLRKYERAHTQGVTSVSFSKDGTHVLSSSYDGLVRVHGIKSGKMLKELRGHTSYVNDAIYSPDGSQVRGIVKVSVGSPVCCSLGLYVRAT